MSIETPSIYDTDPDVDIIDYGYSYERRPGMQQQMESSEKELEEND